MSTAESRARRRERIARDERRIQAVRDAAHPIAGNPRVQELGGLLVFVGLFVATGAIERL